MNHGPYLRLINNTKDFWTRLGLSQIANCPEAIPQLISLLNSNSNSTQEENELVDQTKRAVPKD
jgi:hypothetical protein